MGSRLHIMVVVLFWTATMSWLVATKVYPPMRAGEAPSYQSIVERQERDPPVCWSIDWNNQPSGWAASKLKRRNDGMSEMHSRVFIAQLPIDQLASGWVGGIIKPVLERFGRLDMDSRSRVEVDPLGRLVGFDSNVHLAQIPDAVRMQGLVEGNKLKLIAQSGDFAYKTERHLSSEALVGDALAPHTHLPGLYVGQGWTMPVFSPFRPPTSPMEILQAVVERRDLIVWNGESISALLVVYRSDSGTSLNSGTRGRLWVRNDGLVLKQEVTMFNWCLVFTRLGDDVGRTFFETLEPYNNCELPLGVSKKLLALARENGK